MFLFSIHSSIFSWLNSIKTPSPLISTPGSHLSVLPFDKYVIFFCSSASGSGASTLVYPSKTITSLNLVMLIILEKYSFKSSGISTSSSALKCFLLVWYIGSLKWVMALYSIVLISVNSLILVSLNLIASSNSFLVNFSLK